MTEPIHLAVTTDAPQTVKTAEQALKGFVTTLKQIQTQMSSAGGGNLGNSFVSGYTRQLEQAAAAYQQTIGAIEKRADKTLKQAGRKGASSVKDPFRVDTELGKATSSYAAEIAAINAAVKRAGTRLGVPQADIDKMVAAANGAAYGLIDDQLRGAVDRVARTKASAGNPSGVTGLGASVYDDTRMSQRLRAMLSGSVDPMVLDAKTQQLVSEAGDYAAEVKRGASAATARTNAIVEQQKIEEQVLREVRANYAAQGRLRRPFGAELLTGEMARLLDPGAFTSDGKRIAGSAGARRQIYTDASGAVYGRPIDFEITNEKTGAGRWVERFDRGLVKLGDSRMDALEAAAFDPADMEARSQRMARHLEANQRRQAAEWEQKQLKALEDADARTLRSYLEGALGDGRAVRSGGRIIDRSTGQVYDARDGTATARLVESQESWQRTLEKSAKEQEKYAAGLAADATDDKKTRAQQIDAQAKLRDAQLAAAQAAQLAGLPYGPQALAGSLPPVPPKPPSLGFSAGRGGGGGGWWDEAREALFGDGPGGSGGGLFTKQRLMRQGVSFGGYMLSAAAIGGVMATMADTVAEAKRFEDALTDLSVALGTTERPSSQFITDLGDISRLAGENVSVAMETAARGIRAFGQGIDDINVRESIGRDVADAAAQLAVIADKPLEDATGDLIAAGNAFGLGADGLMRFNDAVAVAKSLGGAPNAIAQGTASLAQIAAEAGFTLQETASIVSAVQARTDLAPRAVAQQAQRILSTLGGSAGRSVISAVNQQVGADFQIDPNAALADQLKGLAAASGQLSDAQRDLVINQIGGRSAATALVAIFDTYDSVLENVESAQGKAGQGAEEFQRRLESFAGLLRQLSGLFTQLQTNLVNSGLFDIFGVAGQGLKAVLQLANELLSVFNLLPRPLKSMGFFVAEAALAMRLLRDTTIGTGLAGAFGAANAARGGAAVQLGLGIADAAPARGLQRLGQPLRGNGVGGVIGGRYDNATMRGHFAMRNALTGLNVGLTHLPSRLQNARAAVNAFGTTVAGLSTLLAGGVLIVKALWDAGQRAREVQGQSAAALGLQSDNTIVGRREMAEQLELQAMESRSTGLIGKWLYGAEDAATALERRAESLIRTADRMEERQRAAGVSNDPADVFNLGALGGVSDGLGVLEENGRSARTQLDALIEAFARLGDGAAELAVALNPVQVAATAGTTSSGLDARLKSLADGWIAQSEIGNIDGDAGGLMDWLLPDAAESALRDQAEILQGIVNGGLAAEAEELVLETLDSTGGRLDAGLKQDLIDEIVRRMEVGFADAGIDDISGFRATLESEVKDALNTALLDNTSTDPMVTQAIIQEALSAGRSLVQTASSEFETLQRLAGNENPALAAARQALDDLRALEEAVEGQELAAGALEQHQVAMAEALLRFSEAAKDVAASQQQTALAAFLAANDPDNQLAQAIADYMAARIAIDAAAEGSEEFFRQSHALNDALKELARYNQAQAVALFRQAEALQREIKVSQLRASGDGGIAARLGNKDRQQAAVDTFLDDLASAPSGPLPQPVRDRAGTPASKDSGPANQKALDRARLAIARRNALLVSDSPLAAAQADVQNAIDELNAQIRGTAEFYDAVAALNDAKASLADLEAELATNRQMLGIDRTNPLAVARAAVQQAKAQLARDIRRGADALVVSGSELALEDAIAQAEQAYFDQRIQKLRTDLDLGRITRVQYLNGLERLANELRAVEGRTFQQQELLDQIDLAIKSAASASSGQFNLGNIDVPTPYEARRAVQAQLSGVFAGGGGGVVDNRTVTVYVNGGNLEEVKRELAKALGSPLTVSPTLTGGRI